MEKSWKEETGFREQVEEVTSCESRAILPRRKGGKERTCQVMWLLWCKRRDFSPHCFYFCHRVGGKVIMRNKKSCEEK